MQLIYLLILLVALFVFAEACLSAWRRRSLAADELFDVERALFCNRVGNIGVSAVLLAPRSMEAVANMLDTLYPATEVVVVVDAARQELLLSRLVGRYALIGVGCRHLINHDARVQGLYRSRSKAFRRLVVVAMSEAEQGDEVAVAAATYDHILRVPRGAMVENYAVGRMVAALASTEEVATTGVATLTGAPLHLVPRAGDDNISMRYVVRPLAWYDARPPYTTIGAVAVLLAAVAVAALTAEPLLVAAALALCGVLLLAMCVSAHLISEKSLSTTFSAVVGNFYEDFVVNIKKISYLYLRKP